jgi:hypothetical protein
MRPEAGVMLAASPSRDERTGMSGPEAARSGESACRAWPLLLSTPASRTEIKAGIEAAGAPWPRTALRYQVVQSKGNPLLNLLLGDS